MPAVRLVAVFIFDHVVKLTNPLPTVAGDHLKKKIVSEAQYQTQARDKIYYFRKISQKIQQINVGYIVI